jgi:hypothetical protein
VGEGGHVYKDRLHSHFSLKALRWSTTQCALTLTLISGAGYDFEELRKSRGLVELFIFRYNS